MYNKLHKLYCNLWWKYMPGTKIKVQWPRGEVILFEFPNGSKISTESADPNDHYRPTMEKLVGKQNWDWGWRLDDNDVTKNRLTIKFRKGKTKHSSYLSLLWL